MKLEVGLKYKYTPSSYSPRLLDVYKEIEFQIVEITLTHVGCTTRISKITNTFSKFSFLKDFTLIKKKRRRVNLWK